VLRELEPLATSVGAHAFAVLLGLLWGSFANVCIYRWPPTDEFPRGRSVVAPGSHCFACQAPIRWYDNVPLLSWLWLRGQCRACNAPFSARYLVVEAVTGALFGVAWGIAVAHGVGSEPLDDRLLRFGIYAAFGFVMVVIAFIDLDHKLILDRVTIPSAVVFYLLGLALGHPWYLGLIGIVIGYGLPWAIGEIYYLLMDREGLGLGDSMLLAVIGALLGPSGVMASLFGGALLGSVGGLLVLLRSSAAGHGDPATSPGRRSHAMLAVIAVVSTVVATATALMGWLAAALAACIVALLALMVSRRLRPDLPADELTEDETTSTPGASPEALPGREVVVRILALVAASAVVFAVLAAMVRWYPAAAICAGVGASMLLVAGRLRGPVEPIDEAAVPTEDAPSLLRTELPFGPFLAMAAVGYMFAAPGIELHFHLPGG
jgi:leader peptidase (prepilin peptidase)/N-methyltransferase